MNRHLGELELLHLLRFGSTRSHRKILFLEVARNGLEFLYQFCVIYKYVVSFSKKVTLRFMGTCLTRQQLCVLYISHLYILIICRYAMYIR